MTAPADRPKRRLPILQGHSVPRGPDEQSDEPERPPWHWSAIGSAAIFLAWLPLATTAQALCMQVLGGGAAQSTAGGVAPSAAVTMILVHLVAFALALFAGGFLVGRFGGRAGRKEAAVAGFFAAALAWALAATQPAQGSAPGPLIWTLILIVLGSVGTAVAYLGGAAGLKRRPPER